MKCIHNFRRIYYINPKCWTNPMQTGRVVKLLSGSLAKFWKSMILKRALDVLVNDLKANFREKTHGKVQFQKRLRDLDLQAPLRWSPWRYKCAGCQFCCSVLSGENLCGFSALLTLVYAAHHFHWKLTSPQ